MAKPEEAACLLLSLVDWFCNIRLFLSSESDLLFIYKSSFVSSSLSEIKDSSSLSYELSFKVSRSYVADRLFFLRRQCLQQQQIPEIKIIREKMAPITRIIKFSVFSSANSFSDPKASWNQSLILMKTLSFSSSMSYWFKASNAALSSGVKSFGKYSPTYKYCSPWSASPSALLISNTV